MDPSSNMISILIKGEILDTDMYTERIPFEHEASISQGERPGTDCSLTEGTKAADTLILDNFCCLHDLVCHTLS